MKIEVFEIASKEDKVYQELLEQYKTNPEVKALLHEDIIPSELIMAGDFRVITMMDRAIEMDNINVYLVKDVDNGTFVWAIGKDANDGKNWMFPLLKKQSKHLQLEIRKVLIAKGIFTESVGKLG